MVKREKGKEKKDYFTNVMIVQAVVCAVVIAFLLFSASSDGKFASVMKTEYEKLMSGDFSSEDAEDAFQSVKEYAAAFSSDAVQETSTESEILNETDSSYIGGGADMEFTSLDTLEGICFEPYIVDFPYVMPLDNYKVTSFFGYRISPVSGKAGIHTGIDLAAGYASPIYAFAQGTVVDSAYDNSYGYYVKIAHDDNIVTIYAHCSKLCVKAGEEVNPGEKIAEVGSTGDSTGNHLHFEMRKDNIRIDPGYLLFADEA